jgi:hypothetical protein
MNEKIKALEAEVQMIEDVHVALILTTLPKLDLKHAVRLIRHEFAHGHMQAMMRSQEFMDWCHNNVKEIENACK